MSIVLKAPAKINLCLKLNGKRSDGYHDLSMIMRTIALFDEITVNIKNNNHKTIDKESQIRLSVNRAFIPSDSRNLIYKIVRYIYDEYNINDEIDIFLNKKVPVGGGLGGGSSDAASILLYLNKYYKLNLGVDELITISSQFGSDIPFFILGKTCICEGRGEILTPINNFNGFYIVLVTPDSNVCTKDIFDKYDELKIKKDDANFTKFKNLQEALKTKNYKNFTKNLFNELQQVTENIVPEVRLIKEMLLNQGADVALMSGSGPSTYGVFSNYFKAMICKQKIKEYNEKYFVYMSKLI